MGELIKIALKAFEECRIYISEISKFENMIKKIVEKVDNIDEFISQLEEIANKSEIEEKTDIRIYLNFLRKLIK